MPDKNGVFSQTLIKKIKKKIKKRKHAKVQVCHRPSRHPERFQILNVPQWILNHHLRHGDNLAGPEVLDGVDNDCNGQVDDLPPGGDPEPFCGNGTVDAGEACDDGNTVAGDGCSAICTIEPFCGDGTVDSGEACDDGNTAAGDGCSATCTIEPFCGDGTVDSGEACDDGGTVAGDGCSATCTIESLDDDNDGVENGNDSAPQNPNVCRDADADTCDECALGTDDPANDGADTDADGQCDAGDTDDDNDGVPDGNDADPLNPNICQDLDFDTCDDCSSGSNDPTNDGPDTDGDGQCDAGDVDNDGFTVNEGDCNDNDPAIHPGATEVCDGLDNNCDGQIDEGLEVDQDNDGFTAPNSCTGTKNDCNDTVSIGSLIFPGNPETCDGLDNDCNGQQDDGIADVVSGSNVGECRPQILTCSDAEFKVVQLAVGPTVEVCDDLDNNCDGQRDEGFGLDVDRDFHTALDACAGTKDDCDDNNNQIAPDAIDACDGTDSNCNGIPDDPFYFTLDLCGPRTECVDGIQVFKDAPEPESCDGLDNDCNGIVDDFDITDALCAARDGIACTEEQCQQGACVTIAHDDGQCTQVEECTPDMGCAPIPDGSLCPAECFPTVEQNWVEETEYAVQEGTSCQGRVAGSGGLDTQGLAFFEFRQVCSVPGVYDNQNCRLATTVFPVRTFRVQLLSSRSGTPNSCAVYLNTNTGPELQSSKQNLTPQELRHCAHRFANGPAAESCVLGPTDYRRPPSGGSSNPQIPGF